MTAEHIDSYEPLPVPLADVLPFPVVSEQEVTADEYELAMRLARILSQKSARIQETVASVSYYEAEQNGAPEEDLRRLRHDVKFWRTVAIDAGSVPVNEPHTLTDLSNNTED
jgi:hypothetical protein